MVEVLHISLFTTVLVLGVTISHSNETMWLYGLFVRLNGSKWAKPLLTCEWCMPSVYSLFGYAGYFAYLDRIETRLLLLYPFVVCLSSILSGVLWQSIILLFKMTSDND